VHIDLEVGCDERCPDPLGVPVRGDGRLGDDERTPSMQRQRHLRPEVIE